MKYLAEGKRGIAYLAKLRNKKVVIKIKREDSRALNSIKNEVYWLKRLNKHNMGPKLIDYGENYLVIGYIKGKRFIDYFKETKDKKKLNKIIINIFNQCYMMDKLKVNKYEMHNPYKHIIIQKGRPVMIDFERCRKTNKPKNITQFCQFLLKLGFKVDRNQLLRLLIDYKKSYDKYQLNKILNIFMN